jgi:hypothetical protein
MADDRLSEEQRKRLFEDQKRKIISSVFSRRNGAGQLDETYVGHLKIWDGGTVGDKARYILLSGEFALDTSEDHHMLNVFQWEILALDSFINPS